MKTKFRKRFLKDLAKIPVKSRSPIESYVFETLPNANSIKEFENIERMKGYTSYFKVRFGKYRIGFQIEDQTIILERVLHRKDIYRYFP